MCSSDLKWFTREQREQMRQAVEDHRASNQNEPRSLYGKIVADADRELSVERIILRALLYGLANYPSLSREEQYERMRDHIGRKYGSDGYLKLWLALPLQVQALSEIKLVIEDEEKLKVIFNDLFDRENDSM